jgi:hypothetical protein
MSRPMLLLCIFLSIGLVAPALSATLYDMWELEAVDEEGVGTHPLVGADPLPENRVIVEGIALNTTGEILDPAEMYTIFLQDETGGLQVWAGMWWYGDEWRPAEYISVEAGDRVRVEGFLADHNGKVFINDRHSASPDIRFTVAILEKGAGMPEATLIPSISACNYFDSTRAGGAEKYQTRWCRINGVEIVSGNWANNEELIISDGSGELTMLLSSEGDFDAYSAPQGKFDVIGIFDQEDLELPFHENYRIWVKKYKYIIPRIEIRKAVKVQWMSTDGVTYQVYRSDDAINWQPVGDPVPGNGAAISVFDEIEGTWKKFYKIEIQ